MAPPVVVIVAGVSGCGKSAVGRLLAQRLNCAFYEGDDFHPQQNISKMKAGIPLTDEDRWPWLATLADKIQQHLADRSRAVISCSALKPAYRAVLRGQGRGASGSSSSHAAAVNSSVWSEQVAFVLLEPSAAELERRLRAREAAGSHFMPASLLASQLADMQFEERELLAHVRGEVLPPVQEIVDGILALLNPGNTAAAGAPAAVQEDDQEQ